MIFFIFFNGLVMEKFFSNSKIPAEAVQANDPPAREPESPEEAVIWRDFLKGSDLALANIYRNYAPGLYNYGRQITTNDELVRDSIQDVFFELLKNRGKLSDAVSIKFYLFASLRRRIFRQLKKHSKIVLQEKWINQDGFQFEANNEIRYVYECFSPDQKKLLQQACNKLPCRQREAITLYYYERLSYGEVAEMMGFAQVKSARDLVYRALDSLNGLLSKWKEELIILAAWIII